MKTVPFSYMAGARHTIHSNILNETRSLITFSVSSKRGHTEVGCNCSGCPVLFVLDPTDWIYLAVSIADTLAHFANLPRLLVVGVDNVDRNRDMLPPRTKWPFLPEEIKTAGGADHFLAFLADEVVPFIDQEYGTAPFRILFGHSFGANFAVHAFSTRPRSSFDAYICLSVTAWYDGLSYIDRLKRALEGLLHDDDGVGGGDDNSRLRTPARGDAQPSRALPLMMYHTIAGEGESLMRGAALMKSAFEDAMHLECAGGAAGRDHAINEPCSHGTDRGEWLAEDKRGRVSYKFRPNYRETHFSQVPQALEDGLRWIFTTHKRFKSVLRYAHMENLERMYET